MGELAGGRLNFLLAWAVMLGYVFFRSTQQRHVQHEQYSRMPWPSYGMAVCEVFVTVNIVRNYDDPAALALLAFALGTGGWMGSMLGTYMHARRRK